jgi:hypothetical protein
MPQVPDVLEANGYPFLGCPATYQAEERKQERSLGIFALNSTLHLVRNFKQYRDRWSKTAGDSRAQVR